MRKVVCLTPVRNESHCLARFLDCASLWADHIVIADQGSSDGSQAIARSYAKVTVVNNTSDRYDEAARQQLLLAAARAIDDDLILVALDADEILCANMLGGDEWRRIIESPPGTVVEMRWANLLPDMQRCWLGDCWLPFAFVDNGASHSGRPIHSPRLPANPEYPRLRVASPVLHYQYADWGRMRRKQMWYQMWEIAQCLRTDPIDLYRVYHHMEAVPRRSVRSIDEGWFSEYETHGIDMRSAPRGPTMMWDRDILNWFHRYGTTPFRMLDIWDVDWNAVAVEALGQDTCVNIVDPRSVRDKAVLTWLRLTQRMAGTFWLQVADRVMRRCTRPIRLEGRIEGVLRDIEP